VVGCAPSSYTPTVMTARGLTTVLLGVALLSATAAPPASATVRRVNVQSRQDVLGGRPFGTVGGYEKLVGVVEFALDPVNAANAAIVDLARAPRDASGRVVASANFMVLRPKTMPRERAVALLEVSNRGGKALLPYFARAAWSVDPAADADFGDAIPLRLGLTIIWVGWQFDVPPSDGVMRLDAPVATDGGRPIDGLVRCDWTVDERTSTLLLGHRGHRPYPIADADHPDNVLTERDGRLAARRVVPRDQWRFVDGDTRITRGRGFESGKIYELVYRARDPVVVGIGLAAVRDLMSYAKYDPSSLFPVHWGVGLGISQTGRFLRHFVYQGFNTDEARRPVFDGFFVHTAGAGRGSFNHRFAQPSRDAHRFSAFFYPTDLFPFSGRRQRDPETGATDGLFAHEAHLPRVFFTNTGYEYWGRAASLLHTTPAADADVEPASNERIYHLAGGQHFVVNRPAVSEPSDAVVSHRGSPLDFHPALRSLLTRLIEWVRDGREPPASAYPRLDAGTLVAVDRVRAPAIPGARWPRVAHEAYRVDYGPRWPDGVITLEPPRLGKPFPVRVPQVDADGNELAGVRSLELLAPLATYTPWSLRGGAVHPDELVDFYGTFIPFARDRAERERKGDPRPSVIERYGDRTRYGELVRRHAETLTQAGWLLAEDVPRVVEQAERGWTWLMPPLPVPKP
jgi:alpha/beta hydrolase family protein